MASSPSSPTSPGVALPRSAGDGLLAGASSSSAPRPRALAASPSARRRAGALALAASSSARRRAGALALGPLLAAVIACVSAPAERPPERDAAAPREPAAPHTHPTITAPPAAPSAPPALLPTAGGPLAPALTLLAAGSPSGHVLTDTDACAACHPDVAAQWRASAHAYASFDNPIYRAGVARFRERLGNERSRFCAGCHDPALLVDGAMDAEVAARDSRAHAGVTCRTCHGVDHATYDGNGSYRLADQDLALPDPRDPESVARHRARVARPALRSGELCGSCHRAFLDAGTGHPVHFAGTDDIGPWLASPFGGSQRRLDDPIDAKRCLDCHMSREPAPLGDLAAEGGTIASHRFVGGHTWLAAIRGDEATLAAARALLVGAASLDITALTRGDGTRALPAESAALAPGERVVLDLVVRNLHVGHRFPGGTRDAQDTRVEVTVTAADGRLLAATGDDPHILRAGVVGDDGHIRDAREVEDLRVAAFDHTILPRDAAVVRVPFTLPDPLPALPLRVDARLVHRSRTPALAEVTCREGRSADGRAFLRATAAFTGERLDPCAAPPATVIAEAALELGDGARLRPDRPLWRRLHELGLGLLHDLQERQDLARAALERALAEVRALGDRGGEALVLAALAEVAAAQGRVDDALALADQVAALRPDHPAADALRGLALSAVWRWPQALAPLARASAAAPQDPRLWVQRAIASGSAGAAQDALEAAQRGLRLAPRDPDLLRSQALALRDLAAADHAQALAAYLAHRPADEAPRWRSRCSAESPACARERLPVHDHPLTPPAAPPR